jgi:hypothetical protein
LSVPFSTIAYASLANRASTRDSQQSSKSSEKAKIGSNCDLEHNAQYYHDRGHTTGLEPGLAGAHGDAELRPAPRAPEQNLRPAPRAPVRPGPHPGHESLRLGHPAAPFLSPLRAHTLRQSIFIISCEHPPLVLTSYCLLIGRWRGLRLCITYHLQQFRRGVS